MCGKADPAARNAHTGPTPPSRPPLHKQDEQAGFPAKTEGGTNRVLSTGDFYLIPLIELSIHLFTILKTELEKYVPLELIMTRTLGSP